MAEGKLLMDPLYVLIHSPLVGPLTWAPVADELGRRGIETLVPVPGDAENMGVPYWQQHVDAVARGLERVPMERPLVLVGHSGAGLLLPAVRQVTARAVAGTCSWTPVSPDGASRLEFMEAESPEWAQQLRQLLVSGGRFPSWIDEDLRELIPDARLHPGLLAELRPRPLAFFAEPIPVFDGWPDAPCGYLPLSQAYDVPAAQARKAGWAYRKLDAGHFHMLVDPAAVANILIALVGVCVV